MSKSAEALVRIVDPAAQRRYVARLDAEREREKFLRDVSSPDLLHLVAPGDWEGRDTGKAQRGACGFAVPFPQFIHVTPARSKVTCPRCKKAV